MCYKMMGVETKYGVRERLISEWERSHSLETDLMTCYNGDISI